MVKYSKRMTTYVSISIPFPSITIHITSPETKNNISNSNLLRDT